MINVAMTSPKESTLREHISRPSTNHHRLHLSDHRQLIYRDKQPVISTPSSRATSTSQRKYVPTVIQDTLNSIIGRDKVTTTKKRTSAASKSAKNFEAEMLEFLKLNRLNIAVVETSSIRKMMAVACFANNKELEGCCHLIASHAACLRQQIFNRHLKSKLRSRVLKQPMVANLDPNDLDIDNTNLNPKLLITKTKTLPSEWYVVQITIGHEYWKDARHFIQQEDYTYSMKHTLDLHLVVIPTGVNATDPICITLPKPNPDSTYDLQAEIEKLLNSNKANLTAIYRNNDLYWKMRKKQNDQMSDAILELEHSWLREWRIILQADHVEHLDLVQDIHDMIDKLIADDSNSGKNISHRTRWLLKKIATGACQLKPFEIERAVMYVLPTKKKLAKNIILSIVAKAKVMGCLATAKRKTLILILDECLDHISFESLKMLKHHPVTRVPSLHILYALFNQHKSTIKDGYKIVRQNSKFGTFIVNPSLDLIHMESRMKVFLEYWLPKWEGLYGLKPDVEFFKNALTKYNVLMYNGHGSGIQFLKGEEIERMRVIASVLLFGCSSLKLLPTGGRQASYGISNQYLMACSPCVLGMLWEVTDGDIDRMTTDFMSRWITSDAKRPWLDVDPVMWNKGKLEFRMKETKSFHEHNNEQDMLVAVAKSKDMCKQYMTSAAIVVRGLPVKLAK